jgi:PA14 domain./F5/8 type C domain./Domain of unknown function (DUF303).
MKKTIYLGLLITFCAFFSLSGMAQVNSKPQKTNANTSSDNCYTPYYSSGNMIADPTFSATTLAAGGFGGWGPTGISHANVFCGSGCGYVLGNCWPNGGSIDRSLTTANGNALRAQTKYRLRAMINSKASPGKYFQFQIEGVNGTANQFFYLPNTNGWKQIDTTFTTGATVIEKGIYFNSCTSATPASTDTCFIDNYELYEVPTGEPRITTSISGLYLKAGSSPSTFNVTCNNLSAPITLSAPAGITLSTYSIPANQSGVTVSVTYDGVTAIKDTIRLTSGNVTAKILVRSSAEVCFIPLYSDRTNLVTDPDVSNLSNFTSSWGAGATIISDPSKVYCGQYCGMVSGTNAGSITYSLLGKWSPNRTYRMKAKVNVTSGTFELSLASWSGSTTANIINLIPVTNGWTDVDFTFTTGTTLGSTSNQYFFFNNYGHGDGVGYIDNIEMYDITLPPVTWSGGPYTFDGTSQFATAPSKVLNNTSTYTISTWVKLASLESGSKIFDFGSSDSKHMYLTGKGHSNNIEFAITDAGSTSEQYISAISNVPLSTSTWQHLAVVQNGNTGILYLNGNEIGRNNNLTLNIASLDSLSKNYIGKSQNNDSYLNGQIDEFKIFNSPLTATEISELIKIVKASKPTPADSYIMLSSTGTPNVKWVSGKHFTSANMYFGNSYNDVNTATTPSVSNISSGVSSVDIPNTLSEGQTYFWRVDELNGTEVRKGDIWKFKYMNPKIKVFLLGGQSNMAGYSPLSEIPDNLKREYPETIIWVDGETTASLSKKWMFLTSGLGNNQSYFGPELSFGPEIAKYLPNEGIALLKYSWGGTNLVSQWRSPSSGGTTGDMYKNFIKSVHDGLAALPQGCQPEIAGMIWMQGESDANQTKAVADEYESNLKNLIKDIRAEFNVPGMPFVLGQISEAAAWNAYGTTIRQAQLNVSKSVANTDMFITTDYGFTDPYHYNGMGEISLGKRFATSMYNILTAKGIKAELFDTNEFVNPKGIRVDSVINFNWGSSSPDNTIIGTNYAIRWSGYIMPEKSGTHTFNITTENGVKLWVNDILIINSPENNSNNVLTGSITLTTGVYSSIKLEYKKNTSHASIMLEWSANGITKQLVPSTALYQNPLYKVDKTKWTIKSVDNQSNTTTTGGAVGILDNKFTTYWKSNPGSALPHEIVIDLNDTLNIASLDYVPNQIDTLAGNALQYKVYASIDGSNWSSPVDSGLWKDNLNQKTVRFVPVVARYVKLRILTSSASTVSASDIALHGLHFNSINTAPTELINTYNNDIFSIYPNPVKNIVRIKLNCFNSVENVNLKFCNLLGQSVFNYEMGTKRDVSFDCCKLLNRGGIYVLVAKSNTNSFAKKFVFDPF